MATALKAFESVFMAIFPSTELTPLTTGPEQWIWRDEGASALGVDRFFIIGTSTEPETVGYPLLTIRQAYSKKLDMWLSCSSLVTGPDEMEAARSIINTVANHKGSVAGARLAMVAMITAGGDPMAGLDAAESLGDQIDRVPLQNPLEALTTPDPGTVN
jgi:hypothetical protein